MANNVVEILRGVVGELREMAQSEVIVSDPITVGDKTVIPIVKISVGFGAGGGQGEATKAGQGFGGGGGGGARIEPAAFIIMDADGVKLLPVQKGSWEGLIDAIPEFASKISSLKKKYMPGKDSEEQTEAASESPENNGDESES